MVLTAVRAADVDLYTPEMQAFKVEYTTGKADRETARAEKLKGLIDKRRERAEALFQQKKKAGNVTGMAVARGAMRLCDSCQADLEEKGDFALPTRIRRELREMLATFTEDKKAADGEWAAETAAAEEETLDRFAELVGEQEVEVPAAPELKELLVKLVTTEPPAAEAAPVEEGESAPEDGGESAPQLAIVLNQGEGTNWVTFARWRAEVPNIEMIDIPVMNRREGGKVDLDDAMTGDPYPTWYEPIRLLTPAEGYLFQVKTVGRQGATDVVEWPSAENDWIMQVRVRPGAEIPSKHALDLQVSFEGSEMLPFVGAGGAVSESGEEPPPAVVQTKVRIVIKTKPAGAVVYVDGRVYRAGNKYGMTPCVAHMTVGEHSLRLRKFGFQDATIPDFVARAGRELNYTLKKDPAFVDTTAMVSARTPWRPSGVTVAEGDKLLITVSGTWSCGAKRERVGAEGYPNNRQFFHYYLNPQRSPRQVPRANYGALLMRTGEDGKPRSVGKKPLKFTAKESGMLYFDVNEADIGGSRRDNAGSLIVRIQKTPSRK